MSDQMKMRTDDDGVLCMPKPLCTYADHSYPAYSVAQVRIVIQQREELIAASKALVDRWDTPNWKDAPHTGEFIARLRDVIAKIEDEK